LACQALQLAAVADLQQCCQELQRQGLAHNLLSRLQAVTAPLIAPAAAVQGSDVAAAATHGLAALRALAWCSGLMCRELQQAGAMALMEELIISEVSAGYSASGYSASGYSASGYSASGIYLSTL
jgi:hypothetical protein